MISARKPDWGKPGKYLIAKRLRQNGDCNDTPWKVWKPDQKVTSISLVSFDAAVAWVYDELKGVKS